jgi:hypothetical protein
LYTAQLVKLVVESKIDGMTTVWKEGMDAWKPLTDVPELKQAIRETNAELEGGDRVSEPTLADVQQMTVESDDESVRIQKHFSKDGTSEENARISSLEKEKCSTSDDGTDGWEKATAEEAKRIKQDAAGIDHSRMTVNLNAMPKLHFHDYRERGKRCKIPPLPPQPVLSLNLPSHAFSSANRFPFLCPLKFSAPLPPSPLPSLPPFSQRRLERFPELLGPSKHRKDKRNEERQLKEQV